MQEEEPVANSVYEQFAQATLFNKETPVGKYRILRCPLKLASGRWYWEVTSGNLTFIEGRIAGTAAVGVIGLDHPLDVEGGSGPSGWFWRADGHLLRQGSVAPYGIQPKSGDVVMMIALDMDRGMMWVGCNGTWLNSGWFSSGGPSAGKSPAFSGITGPVYPALSSQHGNLGTAVTQLSLRISDWKYSAPTGFSAIQPGQVDEDLARTGKFTSL